MKPLKYLIYFSFIILLSSCQRIIDEKYKQEQQENYVNPYKGIYVGTYAGQENGSLKIEVYKSGTCSITRSIGNQTEVITSSVNNNGAFNGYVNTNGFALLGNLETKSGTWKNQNLSGNWSVVKQ